MPQPRRLNMEREDKYPNPRYTTSHAKERGTEPQDERLNDPMLEPHWHPMGQGPDRGPYADTLLGHYTFTTPEIRELVRGLMGSGNRYNNQVGDIVLPARRKLKN